VVLKNELTASTSISFMPGFRPLGLDRLEEKEKHESIDEMKHADKLMSASCFWTAAQSAGPGQALNVENVKEDSSVTSARNAARVT